jgi:hypothetical protein
LSRKIHLTKAQESVGKVPRDVSRKKLTIELSQRRRGVVFIYYPVKLIANLFKLLMQINYVQNPCPVFKCIRNIRMFKEPFIGRLEFFLINLFDLSVREFFLGNELFSET